MVKRLMVFATLPLLLLTLTGCPNRTTLRYSSYTDNRIALKKYDEKVNVGDFRPNYVKKQTADGSQRGSTVRSSRRAKEKKSGSENQERTNEEKTSIMCRAAGPINPPQGQPFSEYIRDAFVDELKLSEVYSETAPVTLTGNVNKVTFSSVSGEWELELEVISSNGESITVSETYDYHTAFAAVEACRQTARAFRPAVQNLLNSVISHPDFPLLLNPRQ